MLLRYKKYNNNLYRLQKRTLFRLNFEGITLASGRARTLAQGCIVGSHGQSQGPARLSSKLQVHFIIYDFSSFSVNFKFILQYFFHLLFKGFW
jgi:hypothetical protein